MPRTKYIFIIALNWMALLLSSTSAFLPPSQRHRTPIRLFALPDIDKMKVGDMKAELESYGISTKSFLEKKEMKEALQKARDEGMKPKKPKERVNGETQPKSSDREKRIKEEMERASKLSVKELTEKLRSMGVSTKAFFEKSEFVRAYAEAIVDGVKAKQSSTSSSSSSKEDYDPSYKDVEVMKMGEADRRFLTGTLIDVTLK